jgi:hypothetical protein
MTGIPKTIKIHTPRIAFALDKSVSKVGGSRFESLETSPQNFRLIFTERGIYLTVEARCYEGLTNDWR